MTESMDPIEVIEIYQLLNRVHHVVDAVFNPRSTSPMKGDYSHLREVYTDDIVYDLSYRGFPVCNGIDEVAAQNSASYSNERSNLLGHHTMNYYVYKEDDGSVRALVKLVSFFMDGSAIDGAKARCYDFLDTLVKTENGWRIQKRVASTRMQDPLGLTPESTIELVKERIGA